MKTFIPLIPVLLLLSACGQDAPSSPPVDSRSVRAEQVGLQGAHSSTRYSGEVRARHETDLAFRVTGRVQARWVEVGTQVKAGQLIATLDPADYALAATAAQAQWVAAEAEARLAQQDLQRYTALRAQNFISQAELDRRQSVSEATQARARQLRAEATRQGNQQAYTRLTAPYAGVVTATLAETGQVVAAGQPVAQLAKTGEREVRINVPENALDALRAARTLKVRLWSEPDRAYAGRLRELSPMADAASRTYSARVSIAEADAAVKLGMTATVEVDTAAVPSLSVAQSALFRINGQPQVWVVDRKTGKVAARSVQLGGLSGERAAIASGVAAGEWVVTAGVHKLAPGQHVRVLTPAQP
ncbi:MAG: efflux transporter periplasmic adaptor subunit [Hydrogenophilales bacterium RIFOXYD1_FULL_62_11]|nr:MAG: efflux transporter periplasmic adaptor subunit [Hydrogenophilales bacterium RIFOXYD1_FULL_62_11]